MDVYILRHGEAGKRLQSGSKDSERPLTVAGEKEVRDVAESFAALGIKFDTIAASPLKRALQTAEQVAKVAKSKKSVEEWNELKPEGNRQDLYKRLSQLSRESSVLLVGHEPYLSSMISEVASDTPSSRIILKKSGLAKLSLTTFHPKAQGELRWLLTPKLLKKISE